MSRISVYKTIEAEVDVEVEIDDFDTEDLVAELERRDYLPKSDHLFQINKIYEKRRMGVDYQQELDELIWQTLGRIS